MTFRLNNITFPGIELPEAVESARNRVFTSGKSCILAVQTAEDRWTKLGYYHYIAPRDWSQVEYDENGNVIPQLLAEPIVPKKDRYREEPTKIAAYKRKEDGEWVILINGERDPGNRTFEDASDVRQWFKFMKSYGLFPNVSRIMF